MTKQEALNNYKQAKQNLKDVSKGGKDYINCSMMDICVRSDRAEMAKEELIKILGEESFKEFEDD